MSQQELLRKVLEVLDAAGVRYLLTGSSASSLQGEPRSTHDIDLLVELDESHVPELLRAFPGPDYYLSESAVREAVAHRRMFNLLELAEGEKVDFWLLTGSAFDQSRFARRRVEDVDGRPVYVSSPEDTILAKLRWAELSGGSEKQFGDALRVYEVQGAALDREYLDHWARELEVEPLWRELQRQGDVLDWE